MAIKSNEQKPVFFANMAEYTAQPAFFINL